MHQDQSLCFGFPLWLVQVGANLVVRHANQTAPILTTNDASLAGCNDATSVLFSGYQTRHPTTLRRRTPRLKTIVSQCRAKFAPTWTSQGGKQEYVRFGGGDCLVSKFAPTRSSQGGKHLYSNRFVNPRVFQIPPHEAFKQATSKLTRRSNDSFRIGTMMRKFSSSFAAPAG